MSVEPPSSGRPTGPPSGPLSGPSGPPPGPPSQPPTGGGGGSQDGQPHQPWWRSAPRIAVLATAVVVAAVLAVVFTRPGGGSGKGGEVFLQAADSAGQDPYTESTATKSSVAPATSAPAAPAASAEPANEVRGVDGGAPGLYSGTKNSGSCDVDKQIRYFQASPSRNKAFAAQVGVRPSGVPAYLRSLTPVQLRADTRVSAHGYRDGNSTTYQAVLQTGTAVLVDGHGMPRVRCACGNPLTSPVAQKSTPRTTGTAWSAYRPSNVVVVAPAAQIVNVFVLFDPEHGDWFGRHRGDHSGHEDRPAKPPANPNPMNPPVHHGCPPTPGRTGSPGATPCPSASTGPSRPSSPGTGSKSPSSNSPSSKPPSSESPKTESPKTESPRSEAPAPESSAPESPKSEAPPSAQPPSPASPGPQSAVSSAAPVSPPAPPSSALSAPPGSEGPGSPAM